MTTSDQKNQDIEGVGAGKSGGEKNFVDAKVHPLAVATALTGSLQVKLVLWHVWAQIAIDHRHLAQSHRSKALELKQDPNVDSRSVSSELNLEFQASLISVVTSAFAVDAFYGAVSPDIPIEPALIETWKMKGTARHSRIFETLKRGFAIGKKQKTWPKKLDWLFGLRDRVVHFREAWSEGAPHPVGPNVTVERTVYTADSARDAVDLMMDILATCQANPNPKYPDLVKRFEKNKHSNVALQDRLAQGPAADSSVEAP